MEFQKEELNNILNIFQQESAEIIASMDDKLLLLERDNNPDIAIQLFRDAHSLKGSARMLGFNHIQNIAHKIEDVIDLIKEKKLKIESEITDAISECLELILVSINKTVEAKSEYISSDTDFYLNKLKTITQKHLEIQQEEFENKNIFTTEQQKFIQRFVTLEYLIVDILFIISSSRNQKEYSKIRNIENILNKFSGLIEDINDDEIKKLDDYIKKAKESVKNFNSSNNKELSFLDVNNKINSFVEAIIEYTNKKGIKRQNYYEIVNEKLDKNDAPSEEAPVFNNEIEKDKVNELIQRIPLLELNCDFFNETFKLLDDLTNKENDEKVKDILAKVKEICASFKEKNTPLSHESSVGIVEVLENIKSKDNSLIAEADKKINLFKTMVVFENKEKSLKEHKKQSDLTSQKEILNSITNTEIKTLRVDSSKLDNLVGQIGELIVSKIKTNEQLSLARKINNDLLDWQKNFGRMDYYIKYFDKKYLSNPLNNSSANLSKVVSYNKQLVALSEQHSEKIANLIKEMSNLFRQIQESEAKLNATSNEIESMVKNMRVLPLSTIFQLFPRMVHNIARDKNKKIDLVITGSEVSADKTIVEELKIPIMHIIRNSIDHGIEDVEIRKKLGKNPVGKIEIEAYYKDSFVVINVKDDGRGLDIEKIKKKALEKKILTQDEINAINDEELTNLIFYPGFSTEDFVTELSGRGLGLDIVHNKINQLQGRIDVFSKLNEGTIVQITLPASVATKKVFIIEEQEQLYAIDTSVIKTIARISAEEIFNKDDNNYFIHNNSAVPIYTLSQILNLENIKREANKYVLAIIETDNITFGIIVQKLISDQDIVMKKLSPPLYKVKHISGITTLANGDACLVLNISDIISTISSRKFKSKIVLENEFTKTQNNYKYNILIVDDSHTTRILQKNILTSYGYNVSTATEPVVALDKVKQTQFDLIISDVQMPNMTGFEFIRELRKDPKYSSTPVIVVSSEPKEKYAKDIDELRIVTYIEKNVFKQDELIKTIENALK